jgi:hypothetical protein
MTIIDQTTDSATTEPTIVYIDNDYATLGDAATQADLDRYAQNLATHLAQKFGKPIEIEQVLGGGRTPCLTDDAIDEYVTSLHQGDGWVDLACPVDPREAAAIAACEQTDPDAPTVKLRAAYRDLNCKGNGDETYRRLRYPGASTEVWPDAERLPRRGMLAGDRRCCVYCDVPVGTIVVDFERYVSRFQGGKCKVTIGIVIANIDNPSKADIVWCEHRTLRSRPVYQVTLPNGSKIEIARRDDK